MSKPFKRLFTLLVLLSILLSLASCSQSKPVSSNVTSTTRGEEFPDIAWADNDLCGVAFFCYYSMNFNEIEEVYTDAYPALAESDYFGPYVGVNDVGYEVFLIVPRYYGSTITVQSYDDMTGDVGEDSYTTELGEHYILLVCNMSDIHSDTLVTVEYEGESVSFSPFLSGKDGSVVLPESGGVKDITLKSLPEGSNSYVNLTGRWGTIVNSQENNPLQECYYEIAFYGDSAISFAHGAPNSEIIDIFEGTYYFAGNNDPEYPEGTLVYSMLMSYSVAFDGPPDNPNNYPLYGAYTVELMYDDYGDAYTAWTLFSGTPLFQNIEYPEFDTIILNKLEGEVYG